MYIYICIYRISLGLDHLLRINDPSFTFIMVFREAPKRRRVGFPRFKKKTVVCWVSISKDREGGLPRTWKTRREISDAKMQNTPCGPYASSPRMQEGEKVQGLGSLSLHKSPGGHCWWGSTPSPYCNYIVGIWNVKSGYVQIEVLKFQNCYIYIYTSSNNWGDDYFFTIQ